VNNNVYARLFNDSQTLALELERRLIDKVGAIIAAAKSGDETETLLSGSIVRCTDPLPLDEYFASISAHFKTRQSLVQMNTQLNDLAHQV